MNKTKPTGLQRVACAHLHGQLADAFFLQHAAPLPLLQLQLSRSLAPPLTWFNAACGLGTQKQL